jgi:DNA-binding response OmpR family regulator
VNDGDAPILLVEDEAKLGLVLKETIEEWGLRGLARPERRRGDAASGRAARGPRPAGLQLADTSAAELPDRLRSENRPIPPVVLMTAGQSSALEVRWPEFVAMLQKPFDLADLARTLERHLPRR